MSNTNINSILEAVGDLDNEVLENAFKPKKKKPIALIVIAAAAALSLVVGFAAASHSGVRFNSGKPMVTFNYYAQPQAHIPTAEELTALGAEYNDRAKCYELTAELSEISALLNTELLTNSENFDEGGEIINKIKNDEGEVITSFINNDKVQISGGKTNANIKYVLTDKKLGKAFTVKAAISKSGTDTFGADISTIDSDRGEDAYNHIETVELIDGSKAFVADRYLPPYEFYRSEAMFCQNGVGYSIYARNIDINEMKQILSNLGITAE